MTVVTVSASAGAISNYVQVDLTRPWVVASLICNVGGGITGELHCRSLQRCAGKYHLSPIAGVGGFESSECHALGIA
jgi:hypothetical protein